MDMNRYLLPAHQYKTYEVHAPTRTHWRRATCQEVDCSAFLHGWQTTVPSDSPQAHYIRRESGRSYREEQVGPGQVRFTFSPGQTCFRSSQHELPNGRPELYIARAGDQRGNPTGERRIHTRAIDWVEDMSLHLDAFAEFQKKG